MRLTAVNLAAHPSAWRPCGCSIAAAWTVALIAGEAAIPRAPNSGLNRDLAATGISRRRLPLPGDFPKGVTDRLGQWVLD